MATEDDKDGQLEIRTKDHLIVRIDENGNVIFGEGIHPDDAARAFWNTVGRYSVRDRNQSNATYQLLEQVGRADLAYERAQKKAKSLGATEHDRFMEEISRRNLEAHTHQLIEYCRALVQSAN